MRVAAGERPPGSSLVRFDQPTKPTIVVDADGGEVVPGSGAVGQVLAGGRLPLGYYNDPERPPRPSSSATATAGWSPATWPRSAPTAPSSCSGGARCAINTGGEKVFPEEVEGVLKGHPDGVRLPRGRRARRALGQRGHRRGAARARARRPRWPSWRPTARRTWPATRRRSTWCWSTPSCARRRARPTTAGPGRPRRRPRDAVTPPVVRTGSAGRGSRETSDPVRRAGSSAARSSRPATRRCGGPGTAPGWRRAASPAPRRALGSSRWRARSTRPRRGWSWAPASRRGSAHPARPDLHRLRGPGRAGCRSSPGRALGRRPGGQGHVGPRPPNSAASPERAGGGTSTSRPGDRFIHPARAAAMWPCGRPPPPGAPPGTRRRRAPVRPRDQPSGGHGPHPRPPG